MEAEYGIKKKHVGSLKRAIEDRAYKQEKYEEQFSMLDKMESTIVLIGVGVVLMVLATSFIIITMFLIGGIRFGESLGLQLQVIKYLEIISIVLLTIGAIYNTIKNKRIREEYEKWSATVDKDRFDDLDIKQEVKFLRRKVYDNKVRLELYRLVEELSESDVEVYTVSVPIIPNENIPKYMEHHRTLLFKEGDKYYQIATKGDSYLKLYLTEEVSSEGLQGVKVSQRVY